MLRESKSPKLLQVSQTQSVVLLKQSSIPAVQPVGWLVDVIYPDPSLESDMQATSTI
jgi:hypothetical protein